MWNTFLVKYDLNCSDIASAHRKCWSAIQDDGNYIGSLTNIASWIPNTENQKSTDSHLNIIIHSSRLLTIDNPSFKKKKKKKKKKNLARTQSWQTLLVSNQYFQKHCNLQTLNNYSTVTKNQNNNITNIEVYTIYKFSTWHMTWKKMCYGKRKNKDKGTIKNSKWNMPSHGNWI